MADSHKDLNLLRYYYTSEESLKDKDNLKNQAFSKYQNNCVILLSLPAYLQLAHLRYINKPAFAHHVLHIRKLKIFSMIGVFCACWFERD